MTNSQFILDQLAVLHTEEAIIKLIHKHNIAANNLTEEQLASVIRQAIEAGDFVKYVDASDKQAVVYIPGRTLAKVNVKYYELIYAVCRKFENETRHETALRYIVEAENKVFGLAVDNPDAKE